MGPEIDSVENFDYRIPKRDYNTSMSLKKIKEEAQEIFGKEIEEVLSAIFVDVDDVVIKAMLDFAGECTIYCHPKVIKIMKEFKPLIQLSFAQAKEQRQQEFSNKISKVIAQRIVDDNIVKWNDLLIDGL